MTKDNVEAALGDAADYFNNLADKYDLRRSDMVAMCELLKFTVIKEGVCPKNLSCA